MAARRSRAWPDASGHRPRACGRAWDRIEDAPTRIGSCRGHHRTPGVLGRFRVETPIRARTRDPKKPDARVLELRKPCRRRVLSGGCGRWAGPRRARALLAAARAVRWRRVPGIRASGGALRFVAAHSGRLYLCCGRRCPHPHPRQLEPGIADRVCVGPPTPTQPGHRAGFFVAVRQRGPSVWWGPAGVPGVG